MSVRDTGSAGAGRSVTRALESLLQRVLTVGLLVAALSIARPAAVFPQVPGQGSPDLAPCDGPDAASWVVRIRDRVVRFDLLARYAIRMYGPPIACEGEVTTVFDDNEFGVLRFGFEGGASFELETQPPETSIAVLRSPAGFADEEEARGALEAYCDDIGVDIDWTSAETSVERGERRVTYADPEEGLNAMASLLYRGATLVGLRFSLAL